MINSDLIAYFKPIASQFSQPESVEFFDMTGRVTNIQANSYRLSVRLFLPAGIYRGHMKTVSGAFNMSTAMIDMVRAPDGMRVPVGPWDLDHLHNVMAVPMARVSVNGRLKGGLWFSMPGPDEIAEGRLSADFGFEAHEGENEVVLELIDRDRQRMNWGKLDFLEIRKDDRRPLSIEPVFPGHPRIFVHPAEIQSLRDRWEGSPDFEAIRKQLGNEELVFLTDNSQGTLELACLFYAITGDPVIGRRAKERLLELVNRPSWSDRPDPLLMGGDNDRGISLRLYLTALGWDYLQPLLDESERRAMLAKAAQYIEKMYDFTLLQRGYMGCPAIDPHSLGAWNGTAIACMAFYEDLEIARRALPLFHGLFCESLKLFPASGKAAWATYFPFHLVLYLAAVHTFGGPRQELDPSEFLDHLGEALLSSFDVPNSQELQRGLRTREHRFLSAFLCRFHPTPGIESIYRAFFEREKHAAGNVVPGIFDLLYAPQSSGLVASFPDRPLFARDVGDLVLSVRGEHTMAVAISAGPKAGRQAVFHLMPQNREFAPSIGALEVTIDGTPVICNINMGQYGLNSALTNAMCFEDGGVVTNGQYLNGAVPPESCGLVRRCLIEERYVYMHIVVTLAFDPALRLQHADRVVVIDRQTGVLLLSDTYKGDRAIRFATHLHCSGTVTDLANDQYRLTGGQANLIAGIKGGGKGLDDAERGEIFVQILESALPTRVKVEEPTWVPGYIYGLNNTGHEDITEGRFPRYRRWRLEALEASTHGSFLLALGMDRGQAKLVAGVVHLPDDGRIQFGYASMAALDVQCECECLLCDEGTRHIVAIGLRRLRHGDSEFAFAVPVDTLYDTIGGTGTIYAQGAVSPERSHGFGFAAWTPVGEESWKTLNTYRSAFQNAAVNKPISEVSA